MNANTYQSFVEAYHSMYESAEVNKANKAMKKKHGLEYVQRRQGANHDIYDLKDKSGAEINLSGKADNKDYPAMTVSRDPKKAKKWVPKNASSHMKKLDDMDKLIKSVRNS